MTVKMPSTKAGRYITDILVIVLCLLFVFLINDHVRRQRDQPNVYMEGGTSKVVRVRTQRDVYQVYRGDKLRSAMVVHLNRFFNLVDFFPEREFLSAQFPVPVFDVRSAYEKGLDSHNWLFVACRTGMVRAVDSVLPDRVFREKAVELRKDSFLFFSDGRFRGFTYDIPWSVSTAGLLPVIDEPVVINVDAGYFMNDEDPAHTAAVLKKRCPKAILLVLIDSYDEPDIPEDARTELGRFESLWRSL